MCKQVGSQGTIRIGGGIKLDLLVLRVRARQKTKCCSEHFGDRAVGNAMCAH
jgi:hypothetical protein